MAYDAISAAPPPAQGAASSAGQGAKAGATGAQPSPFGALMAMFDATVTPQGQTDTTVSPPETEATQLLSHEAQVDARDGGTDATQVVEATDTQPAPVDPLVIDAASLTGLLPAASSSATALDAAPPQSPPVAPPTAPAGAITMAAPPPPAQQPSQAAPAQPVDIAEGQILLAATPEESGAPVAPPQAEASQSKGDIRRAEFMNREPGAAGAPAAAASPESGNSNGRPSGEHPGGGQFNDPRTQGLNESRAVAPVETAAATAPAPAPETPAPSTAMSQPAAPQTAIQVAQLAAALPVRGSPDTVAHFAAQLIQKLEGQTTRFDLSLNPQSLGRVDVRIEIDRKGALRAHMAFDTAEAVQQIGGRHAELRAALENAGFELAEGALSFDVASGGRQGGAFGDADANAGRLFQTLAEAADAAPAVLPSYFNRTAAGGVDIRV